MSEDFGSYVPMEPDGSSREPDTNVYFMVRALLNSRVETGLSSDDLPPEEDVNMYLTHLLCDFIRPQYHERIHQYVASFDTSVFEQVRNTTDNRYKYTVYKTNADFILMMMGLFHNPDGERPHALPQGLQIDNDTHVGRGKTYYDFAFTYSRSLFGLGSGITDVLNKLSHGFERYVRLLMYMRSEYLNLVDRISLGTMYHLHRELQDVQALRNAFLDAYSEWQRQPTPSQRARVQEAAAQLQSLDPDFRFEFPEE